jgi:prolyl-tRNA synthetase
LLSAEEAPQLPDCPHSGQDCQLEEVNGIEVAHTFYLGTKYSSMFGASFSDKANTEKLPYNIVAVVMVMSTLCGLSP